jgi:hypothetical protein
VATEFFGGRPYAIDAGADANADQVRRGMAWVFDC